MKIEYIKVESTEKPKTLELTTDTVYLRKDIVKNTKEYEHIGAVDHWTYQEAKMSYTEFNEYGNSLLIENAIKGRNDSDNIQNIISGQRTGDSNILSIMEAVADLYVIIETMSSQ